MAKTSKVKSSSSGAGKFPQGGKGKMFGKMGAAPQKPGQTTKTGLGAGGGKFPKGGNGKMFGHMSADKQTPGRTSKA